VINRVEAIRLREVNSIAAVKLQFAQGLDYSLGNLIQAFVTMDAERANSIAVWSQN
jgi:hypothetical protein